MTTKARNACCADRAAPRAISSNSCRKVRGGGRDARERDCRRGPDRDPDLEGVAALSLDFFFVFRLGAMAAAYGTIQVLPHCGKQSQSES
jgi:hypothetical protein